MAIAQATCTSFKAELFTATHNFSTDVFKIALYTDAATLDATTTAYTTTGEVAATGAYVAGGQTLTGVTLSTSGTQALVTWSTNPTWPATVLTARGALIYNSSKSNKAVAVLDFGNNKTSTLITGFTVVLPPGTINSAILRNA